MDTPAFEHWLAQLGQLTGAQRTRVQRALLEPPLRRHALEGVLPDLGACPHCQAPPAQLAPWG